MDALAALSVRALIQLDLLLDRAAPDGLIPLEEARTDISQIPTRTAADFTGEGRAIVVIDDGYSPFYDQSNTVDGNDFFGLSDDPDASVNKRDSHGSWVAQTALAVAPDLAILHFKVLPDFGGNARLPDIEQALDAVFDYAETWEIAAVNLSLGLGNEAAPETTQLTDEIADLHAAGIATVVAAGNDGARSSDGVSDFAADPLAIGVSATTEAGRFAPFSQRHPELTDIAALGEDIPVVALDGETRLLDGTSFSAPYVTATIARLQQASEAVNGRPLSVDDVVEIMQTSGAPVSDAQDAPGYRVLDSDMAVEYFLANSEFYADPLDG
ncbi:MAG: S8 family serine peptidase [Pikeienuella sp.]